MLNKVQLIGNLGRDPEVRHVAGDHVVTVLRVATSCTWADKQSGQRTEETEWHDVEVWGKQAEHCGEYLRSGRQVYVEGRLKYERWQDKQSGQERHRAKIVAETVKFLGGHRSRVGRIASCGAARAAGSAGAAAAGGAAAATEPASPAHNDGTPPERDTEVVPTF